MVISVKYIYFVIQFIEFVVDTRCGILKDKRYTRFLIFV